MAGFSNRVSGAGSDLTAEELLWVQTGDAGVLLLEETTAPSATAGVGKLYVKSSDGLLYYKDDAGSESVVSLGSVGANTALSNLSSVAINAALVLDVSDAFALGSATKMWSDLFLASGAVINFNNGDVTITHAANVITVAGGTLAVPDDPYGAGWNGSADVPTKNAIYDKIEALGPAGATTALDNLSAVAINAALVLATSDAFALGSATKMWSDLFLASGGVIDFNNGDVTITHSADTLTIAGGALVAAAITGTVVTSSTAFRGPDGSVSTPSYGYVNATNAGWFWTAASSSHGLAISGAEFYRFTAATGLIVNHASGAAIGFGNPVSSPDLLILRDAANILAQRRTTNAQTFRLYRTFTDSSNYERLALQTGAGYMELAAETAGTGTDDISIRITPSGVGGVSIGITAPFTAGTIELGHASDTTLTRASAGVLAVEGVNVLTTATGLALAGGTMTGNITLGENTSIALDPAGSADGKYSGITIAGTAGATLAFGDLCYLAAADSRWELADADAAGTADRMMGMCVLAAAGDGSATVMLLMGQIRADAKFPALTIGSAVYVGETAGAIQVAIPTGADNVIRRVGYALTADEIYFNPSMDSQITVA